MPYSHAHYAGNLVDGAYSLGLFGDVATEMCILTDGDEGLFASYSDVQFRPPCGPATCWRSLHAGARRHPLAGHGVRGLVVGRGAATPDRRARPGCST